MERRELFFPFVDGSLGYDCPSCGSHCCKGSGISVLAATELAPLVQLRPAIAAAIEPHGARHASLGQFADGCFVLRPDGLCDVELSLGRDAKPGLCRLFPFNRLVDFGGVLMVGFNGTLCPIEDRLDARSGESWERLAAEVHAVPDPSVVAGCVPDAGPELRWLEHEAAVRDATPAFVGEDDYCAFAGWQEAAAVALLRREPLPAPGDRDAKERANRLAKALMAWRKLFGVEDEPALAPAARRAARLAALLTSWWRLAWLAETPRVYTDELQRLPRQLLASAFFVELLCLARSRPPGVRAAMQSRFSSTAQTQLLSLFDRPVRLRNPLPALPGSPELADALAALSQSLTRAPRPLIVSLHEALAGRPPQVRGLAFSWLAASGAELESF